MVMKNYEEKNFYTQSFVTWLPWKWRDTFHKKFTLLIMLPLFLYVPLKSNLWILSLNFDYEFSSIYVKRYIHIGFW